MLQLGEPSERAEPSGPLCSVGARLVGWLTGLASEPTLSLARLATLKSLARPARTARLARLAEPARLFANPVSSRSISTTTTTILVERTSQTEMGSRRV